MGWERHAVTQVATGASCIDAGPIPVGTAAVLAHEQQRAGCQRMARTAASRLRYHGRLVCAEAVSATMDSPVASSAPLCMWCTRMGHANGALQQAAGAPMRPPQQPRISLAFDRAAAPLVCLGHQASQQSALSRW